MIFCPPLEFLPEPSLWSALAFWVPKSILYTPWVKKTGQSNVSMNILHNQYTMVYRMAQVGIEPGSPVTSRDLARLGLAYAAYRILRSPQAIPEEDFCIFARFAGYQGDELIRRSWASLGIQRESVISTVCAFWRSIRAEK